jgi:elongation factor G
VTVPAAFVGAVMSDLSGRRARVTGSDPLPEHEDRTVVRAEVPDLQLLAYAADLRSLSHGTGTYTRKYLRHEAMPSHLVPPAE